VKSETDETAAAFGLYVFLKFAACGERHGNMLTGNGLLDPPDLERGLSTPVSREERYFRLCIVGDKLDNQALAAKAGSRG